jgi:hypothetical protein
MLFINALLYNESQTKSIVESILEVIPFDV